MFASAVLHCWTSNFPGIPACCCSGPPERGAECSIRSLILGNRTVWAQQMVVSTRDLLLRPACCPCGQAQPGQRSSIKGLFILVLHARKLEPAGGSDALMLMGHCTAGVGPFSFKRFNAYTQSTQTGQPRRQAGMPFRFLVTLLLTRARWFCAMTPRAPSCHSLRHAACGIALWARELLLWPRWYLWFSSARSLGEGARSCLWSPSVSLVVFLNSPPTLDDGAGSCLSSVLLIALNTAPWADSASRTTVMPASRLWSTSFRGQK